MLVWKLFMAQPGLTGCVFGFVGRATPLHLAAREGHKGVITALLQVAAGADESVTDAYGYE